MSDSRLHKKLVFLHRKPFKYKKNFICHFKGVETTQPKILAKNSNTQFFYSDLYLHFLDHAVEIFSKLYVQFQTKLGNKSHNLTYYSSVRPAVVCNFSEIESTFPVSFCDYVADYPKSILNLFLHFLFLFLRLP